MTSRAAAVERLDVFVLAHDVAEPRGVSCAWYDRRESVLVRLTDADGLTGWGETYLRPGVVGAIEGIGASLVGEDALRARSLFARMSRLSSDGWAISALSTALDDLRARRLGIPVFALYGGTVRDRVRAYASSGGYYRDTPPERSWPDEVERVAAAGFSAFKFRIGRFAPERELPILERVRAGVSADVEFLADANGAYALPRAIAVGHELGRLGFGWFEEPLVRFQAGVVYPGYERLTGAVDVAIAAAEGLETRSAFAAFLARGGADIVQPDVGICGGVGEALFVAELAALDGRLCVPHCWGGAVLLAATLQLLAVLPEPTEVTGMDSPLLELDTFENPMLTELLQEPIRLVDGSIRIPTAPGLGVEIDEDAVRRLSLANATG